MPDITVNVRVVGADQAAGDLNKVGTAAQTAGRSSKAAGSDFFSVGGRLAGAAVGAMALTNGLFGVQDAFDEVSKSDLNLARAHRRTEIADRALQKAQADMNNVMKDTTKTIRDNNGAVGTQTEHILSYNAATDEAIVQTRTSNGELKISTKNIKSNSQEYQNLQIALDGSRNAHENEAIQARENTQVHQRLGASVAQSGVQIGLGGLAIAGAVVPLVKMAVAGRAAAAAASAAATSVAAAAPEVAEVGVVAGGSAVGVGALGAVVGTVGATMGAMKGNVLGARDAIGGTANAAQKAVPALQPIGGLFDGIMKKAGILPDPLNTANTEIKTSSEGISRQLQRMGQIGGQGIDFVSKGFTQFSKQITAGDIGGAIDTVVGGISAGFDKLKAIGAKFAAKDIFPLAGALGDSLMKGLEQLKQNIINFKLPTLGGLINFAHDMMGVFGFEKIFDFVIGKLGELGNLIKNNPIFKSLNLAFNATIDWAVKNVWPAIQTIIADLKAAWGVITTAYDATVNWIAKHVWPALANISGSLHQAWGVIVTAYDATINWLAKNVWPVLANIPASLHQAWGVIVTAYDATVNWIAKHVWPALQDVGAALAQVWGQVQTAYNATINWALKYVWPVLSQVWPFLVQAWGQANAIYNGLITWFFKYIWPTLSEAWGFLSQAWGEATHDYNALIKFIFTYQWPDLGTEIKKWLDGLTLPDFSGIGAKIVAGIKSGLQTAIAGLDFVGALGTAIWNSVVKYQPPDFSGVAGKIITALTGALKAASAGAQALLSFLHYGEGGVAVLSPQTFKTMQGAVNRALSQRSALAARVGPSLSDLGAGTSTRTATPTPHTASPPQAAAAATTPTHKGPTPTSTTAGPGLPPFPRAMAGAGGPYMLPASPYRTPTGTWAWHYVTHTGAISNATPTNFLTPEAPISPGGGGRPNPTKPGATINKYSGMRTNVAPIYTTGPTGKPSAVAASTTTPHPVSIVRIYDPPGSVVFPFYYVNGVKAYAAPSGFRAAGTGQLLRFAQGGTASGFKAARGGSFVVDHLMQFGNITVGEGRNPELVTLIPFANGVGGGIVNVTPLKGTHKPHGLRDGGSAGMINTHMFGGLTNAISHSSRGEGGLRGHGYDIDHLISLLRKLIAMQIGGRGLEANLFVDGQHMASVAQRYMGSKSYGDR